MFTGVYLPRINVPDHIRCDFAAHPKAISNGTMVMVFVRQYALLSKPPEKSFLWSVEALCAKVERVGSSHETLWVRNAVESVSKHAEFAKASCRSPLVNIFGRSAPANHHEPSRNDGHHAPIPRTRSPNDLDLFNRSPKPLIWVERKCSN